MTNCTICHQPLFRPNIDLTERARLTEVCEECHMLGRTVRSAFAVEATMTKDQWLAIVDMLYDSNPYGPERLRKWLDQYQQALGEFEPWRTWAMERWIERFEDSGRSLRNSRNPK